MIEPYKAAKKVIWVFFLSFSFPTSAWSKPLKILFVVDYFLSPTRPFILNQITGLLDRGHDVHIFALKYAKISWPKNTFPPEISRYKLEERTYIKKLPVHTKKFDIIFCQFGELGNMMLHCKQQPEPTPKLVVCFRGADASSKLLSNPHLYDTLYEKGDCFLPVSDHFATNLIAHGCPPNKVVVHHSAIDCTNFLYTKRTWPEDNIIRILSLTRLHKGKGIEYALEAIAHVAKKYPAIQYNIYGRGNVQQKKALTMQIRQLGLEAFVEIHEVIPHSEVIKQLLGSHIFLLPSYTTPGGKEEGIPNAIMEALATGLPVVSTYHGGIPEVVEDGVSGLLVSEKDSYGLAQAILDLIAHPESWSDMGRAGRKKIEQNHSIANEIKKLENLFQRLVQKKPKKN